MSVSLLSFGLPVRRVCTEERQEKSDLGRQIHSSHPHNNPPSKRRRYSNSQHRVLLDTTQQERGETRVTTGASTNECRPSLTCAAVYLPATATTCGLGTLRR